ncbi:MAG: hypothetical protein K2Y32_01650 [Candidatus Obscuribacterales bacterium]|nr:hypothetical protein [Candidatus Obscuribacterales bacterium]
MKLSGGYRFIFAILALAGLALAAEEAYVWRNLANLWDTDLISYLDNGEAFWKADWRNFINPYWSPLYGIIVALVLKAAAGNIENEIFLVRMTNLGLFAALCLCFLFLLNSVKIFIESRFKTEDQAKLAQFWGLTLVSLTAVFVYSSLTLGQTMYGTPDLLSSCFAFIITGLALRLAKDLEGQGQLSLKTSLLLAASGFVGYLSKAPILAYAALTLLGLLASARKVKQARSVILVGLAALFILCAPYIALISSKAEHLTFSDVWKVGQSWNIFLKQPITHGRSPSFLHPTRIYLQKPEAYEFADDRPVTYSPWYAPYYWYAGVETIIEWHEYLPRVLANLVKYSLLFLWAAALFWLIAWKTLRPLTGPCSTAFLWLPVAAGLGFMLLGIDMSVNSERYYTPYLVPLFTIFFISLKQLPKDKSYRALRLVCLCLVTFALLRLTIFAFSYSPLLRDENRAEGFRPVEITIASLLKREGLQEGDKIAQLGSCRYYFARLAKLKIVVDFVKPKEFWQLGESEQAAIVERLKKLGVKAVVQEPYLREVPLCLSEEELPRPSDQRLKNWLTLKQTGQGWALVPAYQANETKWTYPSTFMILKLD